MADDTDFETWLTDGDVPEADWASYILRRALRGQLGDGGEGILLDMVPLTQPYACSTGACTPGMRGARSRSCCADLDVGLTEREEDAIRAVLPEVAEVLEGDPRWAQGIPEVVEDGTLRRVGRRCIFAKLGPEGLSCALHALEDAKGWARGRIKPMPCRLFPLAVVELGDGRMLLTAIHRDTATALATRPARVFPCLKSGATPLYVSERAAITELFGPDTYAAVVAEAEAL